MPAGGTSGGRRCAGGGSSPGYGGVLRRVVDGVGRGPAGVVSLRFCIEPGACCSPWAQASGAVARRPASTMSTVRRFISLLLANRKVETATAAATPRLPQGSEAGRAASVLAAPALALSG